MQINPNGTQQVRMDNKQESSFFMAVSLYASSYAFSVTFSPINTAFSIIEIAAFALDNSHIQRGLTAIHNLMTNLVKVEIDFEEDNGNEPRNEHEQRASSYEKH